MMLEAYGSERYYHFNPIQHSNWVTQQKHGSPTFPTTVHISFEEGFLEGLSGEKISELFNDYGDFYLQKDGDNSCYIEFFMLDKVRIPDQKLATFMALVTSQPELKVTAATMHRDAPIFKAHNIIDER